MKASGSASDVHLGSIPKVDSDDPDGGLGDIAGILKHSDVPDPFAKYDGMGSMSQKSQNEMTSVDDEMKRTEESLNNFKPALPPSVEHPRSTGIGGLSRAARAAAAPPSAPAASPPAAFTREEEDREAESNPMAAPDPLQSGISYANDEGMTEEQEEAQERERETKRAEEEEEEREKEKEAKDKKREEEEREEEKKKEQEQEAWDQDGGPLKMKASGSASDVHLGSIPKVDSDDPDGGLGDIAGILKHSDVPDPFAKYDGMGSMSQKSQNEMTSVDDEMKRTEESLNNFKPALPPSVEHPRSTGIGGLSRAARAAAAPPSAPAASPPAAFTREEEDREAESNPMAAPDPLQSGISYANDEGMTEEQEEAQERERETKRAEEEEEEREKEKEAKDKKREEEEREEEKKKEQEQEAWDQDGGPLKMKASGSASDVHLGSIPKVDSDDPDGGLGDIAGILKHSDVPDPFAKYDGMGSMSQKSQNEMTSVDDEMKRTEESLNNFKPALPPSVEHPRSTGIGGLSRAARAAAAPPSAPAASPPAAFTREEEDREAESNPMAAPDPLQSGISYANDEGMTEEQEEAQERERETKRAEEEEEEREKEKEAKDKKREEEEREEEKKKEQEQEAWDQDGGPLKMKASGSASDVHLGSIPKVDSDDPDGGLGDIAGILKHSDAPDPFERYAGHKDDEVGEVSEMLKHSDVPDPFAKYDGMGGMSQKSQNEMTSVDDEMKRTEESLNNFKPALPPSETTGVGDELKRTQIGAKGSALPTEARTGFVSLQHSRV